VMKNSPGITVGEAWHKIHILFEDTICAAQLTESGGQDQPTRCSVAVTRFAQENEFPAYDRVVFEYEGATWDDVIAQCREFRRHGDFA